ncbi:MAG TPA: LysR family transcriptional regulator [Acetobacteraceae bacterium]|nr:LysR family transcriptional regulator [Acetobacteraceae bacterium]
MDVRSLRYFVTIAELGSFSAAARHLNIAQPALSRHIRELETRFATRLLLRTPRGVSMTDPGERLFRYGLSILGQIEQVAAVVKEADQPITGLVTIGLPTSASAILSRLLLTRAKQKFPGVRVHLIESLSGFLDEWVQTRRLDLAILFDAEPSPNLRLDDMLVEDLCLVGRAGAFPPGARTIPFRRLEHYPLLLPGVPHSLRRLLESMARSHGLRLDIAYEVDSLAVVKRLARAGDAYAILAEGAAHEEIASGQLRALKIVRPNVTRSVSLAASVLPGGTPACEEIRRLILELGQELRKSGAWKAAVPPPRG